MGLRSSIGCLTVLHGSTHSFDAVVQRGDANGDAVDVLDVRPVDELVLALRRPSRPGRSVSTSKSPASVRHVENSIRPSVSLSRRVGSSADSSSVRPWTRSRGAQGAQGGGEPIEVAASATRHTIPGPPSAGGHRPRSQRRRLRARSRPRGDPECEKAVDIEGGRLTRHRRRRSGRRRDLHPPQPATPGPPPCCRVDARLW